jgi:hydroxyacylglutathione hydrolase
LNRCFVIHIEPVAAFADNYFWILHNGQHAWVTDPGDAAPVLHWLAARHMTLAGILLTHHHADHTGGVAELTAGRPMPVIGPAQESIAGVTQTVREPETVQLPELGITLQVLDVPGHTAGHIAYYGIVQEQPVLLCGDTLFAAGCGRLFEGTPAQMWQSLNKLAALPAHTRAYCAHEYTLSNLAFALAAEPENAAIKARMTHCKQQRAQGLPTVPFELAQELATNPFLRAGSAQRFAQLREWKNTFRAVI